MLWLCSLVLGAIGPPTNQSSPGWVPYVPCRDNIDCALNGVCTAGRCSCRVGWEGTSCEKLVLTPPPDVGAYGFSPNISSWGCSVHLIDGLHHMWVSEFWGGCGVSSWQHNSHIVHATSTSLEGPYTYQDTALTRFSHNPKVLVDAHTHSLTLFHIGSGAPYPPNARCSHGAPLCDPTDCNKLCNCSNEPMPHEVWPVNRGGGMHNASTPEGPWLPAQRRGLGGCNNPGPATHPNGTVFIFCHNNGLQMYSTNSTTGTYTKIGTNASLMPARFLIMNTAEGIGYINWVSFPP
jgi:hypothetical protein